MREAEGWVSNVGIEIRVIGVFDFDGRFGPSLYGDRQFRECLIDEDYVGIGPDDAKGTSFLRK